MYRISSGNLQTVLLCFSLSILCMPTVQAGDQDQPQNKKCVSLRKLIQKCGSIGVPFLIHSSAPAPAEAGYWASGMTLDCTNFDLMSFGPVGSVGCLQFGSTSHGVTCSSSGLAYSGPYSGVICTQIYTPDERGYRDCTQTGFDTIGQDAGVVCDQYGFDYNSPYCTATAVAQAGGVENVMCSQIYCPSCLYYVNDQCFPDATWVKVREADGSTQLKSMRSLRLNDMVQSGTSPTGEEVYSPIVDIPHRQPGKRGHFLQVQAGDSSFLISPEHLLFVAQEAGEAFDATKAKTKFAKDLAVGDILWTSNSTQVALEKLPETVSERGMYAPETEAGTLVVYGSKDAAQGVVVSCYATFPNPSLTQAYLRARRAIAPVPPIEDTTVRRSSYWEEGLVHGMQKLYPKGFSGTQDNSHPEQRPRARALRSHQN